MLLRCRKPCLISYPKQEKWRYILNTPLLCFSSRHNELTPPINADIPFQEALLAGQSDGQMPAYIAGQLLDLSPLYPNQNMPKIKYRADGSYS